MSDGYHEHEVPCTIIDKIRIQTYIHFILSLCIQNMKSHIEASNMLC